jgi:hypothetical protein
MDLLKNVFIIALLGLPLAACDSNDGPVEKLGKDVDKTSWIQI